MSASDRQRARPTRAARRSTSAGCAVVRSEVTTTPVRSCGDRRARSADSLGYGVVADQPLPAGVGRLPGRGDPRRRGRAGGADRRRPRLGRLATRCSTRASSGAAPTSFRHGTFDWTAMAPDAYVPDIPRGRRPGDVAPRGHAGGAAAPLRRPPAGHPRRGRAGQRQASRTTTSWTRWSRSPTTPRWPSRAPRRAAAARRHRAALEQLLQVSSQLTETFSIETILRVGLRRHPARARLRASLAIDLPDPDTGRLVARAAAAAGI